MAQTFLPLVQSVAGAIPIAGHPLQAAISGLLSTLQLVNIHSQNKAGLRSLALRLERLCLILYNAPATQDPLEQRRRNLIIGIIQETSTQLTTLRKRRLEYASVSQAIAACSSEINSYLADYSWSSQMQSQHDIRKMLAILQGPQSTAAVKLGCVTLVDATGHEHAISLTFCTSFQQLNGTLQALFTCDSIEAQLQRQYMEQEQYDLCIDNDKQVTRLTSHEWPSIEAGTTIVMRCCQSHRRQVFACW
ncbi:hypothetical protein BDR04DRAFT_387274 [Suillus decipiens]|nr:hypothetical protein BDR04DRAFT_387274 [Suillus decipiens]